MVAVAGIVEEDDRVVEVFGRDVVTGCPLIPGIEGGDGVPCEFDALVEVVEGAQKPRVVANVSRSSR